MQNGTGGAVMYARQFVGNDPFVVIYGDDVIIGDDPCTAQCCRAYEKYGKAVVSMKEVPFELVLKYCTLEKPNISATELTVFSLADNILLAISILFNWKYSSRFFPVSNFNRSIK